MRKIVVFLLVFAAVLLTLASELLWGDVSAPITASRVPLLCALSGGIGGCVYCLRAVYLNACVRRQWDDTWQPWYYIRPFVSLLCGGISWLFLKAGLLILEANSHADASELGFYALGFIAGLNVDKFIAKVEDVAQAAWGIEKSRASRVIQESPTEKMDPDPRA